MKSKADHDVLRTLRKRAFDDAVAGRPASRTEPEYLSSYKRGVARRKLLREGGMDE